MKRTTVLYFIIIAIFSLFATQWLRDAGLMRLNFEAVLADTPIGQLLGATQNITAVTASHLRKGFISDNYSRCSMKMGVEWRWEGLTTDQIKTQLKQFNPYGTRYTTIRIGDLGEGALDMAARVINEAKNLQIIPIVIIEGSASIPDAASVVTFYSRLSESTGVATFVASTYKASPFEPGVDYYRQEKAIAEAVASDPKIREDEDIVIATPVLGGVTDTNFRDIQELSFNNLLDGSYFDIMLMGLKNADGGFGSYKSVSSERGYYIYGSQTGETYRPLTYLTQQNDANKEYMRTIVVDYGPTSDSKPGNGPENMNKFAERMAYDFGLFADDLSVEAVVVNPYTLGDPNQWLSDNLLGVMARRATNCNYDLANVASVYESNGQAPVCATADVEDDVGGQAKTKVVCKGKRCLARIIYTVQVGLPVAEFTSVNPAGTPTNPYMPNSGWIGANTTLPQYDFTNQFAGELTDENDNTYFFPNLGSAINNAGQVIKSQFSGARSQWEYDQAISQGAGLASSNAEVKADVEADDPFETWLYGYNGEVRDKTKISEEGTVCVGKLCMTRSDYLEQIDSMRTYDPNQEANTFKQVLTCGGQIQRVEDDQKNMVYGAEKRLEADVVWSGTAPKLCYEVWKGRPPLEDGGLRCRTKPTSNPAVQCRCNDRTIPVFNEQVIRRGYNGKACELSDEVIDSCLQYVSGASSLATSVVTLKGDLPAVPQYQIEGAYDALAAMYKKVQDQLSARGLKAVFNEGWGWESEVTIRAYHGSGTIPSPRKPNMLRPTSALVSTPPPEAPISGSASLNSCQIGVNFAGGGGDAVATAGQLGYSHALAIVNGPSDDGTGQLNAICSAGMTPILRSCVRGNCSFTSGTQQGEYLANAVNNASACAGSEIFVVCGHNEPESEFVNGGSEAAPSVGDFERDLRKEGEWTRDCLNAFNDAGGSAQVTTPTFNATLDTGNWNIAKTAAAFQAGFGGRIQDAGFACVSFNDYENVGGRTAVDWYNTIMELPEFQGMSACINETGYYQEGASQGNIPRTEAVVNDLLGAGDTLYALLFNSMGTNPSWMQYALADKGASIVAGCGGAISSAGYQASLNLYPADGNNTKTQYQYYAMLGFLDELTKLNDVLAQESTLPGLDIKLNPDTNKAYVATASETDAKLTAEWFAGWASCEEPWIKALVAQGKPVNCLAPYVTSPENENYTKDPLEEFLCKKGYPVSNLCGLTCNPEVVLSGNTDLGPEICHPGNACDATIQQGKGGVGYPACRPEIKVANTDTLCNDLEGALDEFTRFGSSSEKQAFLDYVFDDSIEMSSRLERVEDVAEANSEDIGIFGTWFKVNSGIVSKLRAVEQDIAQWKTGNSYNFPSGAYTFISYGGFNRRAASCSLASPGAGFACLSAHSFGIALDFNGGTNLSYPHARTCGLDMPPEFVNAMEKNGFRWGGRYGGDRFDPMHFEYVPSCLTGTPSAGDVTTGGATTTQLVCRPAEEGGVEGGKSQCNEFNCFKAGVNDFNSSLKCAADTFSGDIFAGKRLSVLIDEYGPFCDNETRELPFAHNLLNLCYDQFAPAAAARTCQNNIPGVDELKPEDAGLLCPDFQERNGTQGDTIGFRVTWDEYQYYRQPIDDCTIPAQQLRWTEQNSRGMTPEQLASDMQQNMNYLGLRLSNTPLQKITAVVEQARQSNINPYLLMCAWATESGWGQYRPSCNVY